MVQAESPEWTPASSMCSITPQTSADGDAVEHLIIVARDSSSGSKSATTSTSTSTASPRKRSIRTGAF